MEKITAADKAKPSSHTKVKSVHKNRLERDRWWIVVLYLASCCYWYGRHHVCVCVCVCRHPHRWVPNLIVWCGTGHKYRLYTSYLLVQIQITELYAKYVQCGVPSIIQCRVQYRVAEYTMPTTNLCVENTGHFGKILVFSREHPGLGKCSRTK